MFYYRKNLKILIFCALNTMFLNAMDQQSITKFDASVKNLDNENDFSSSLNQAIAFRQMLIQQSGSVIHQNELLYDKTPENYTDNKLFFCLKCPKSYKREKNLKNHEAKEHPDILPCCPECNLTFINPKDCKNHREDYHPAYSDAQTTMHEIVSSQAVSDELSDDIFSEFLSMRNENTSAETQITPEQDVSFLLSAVNQYETQASGQQLLNIIGAVQNPKVCITRKQRGAYAKKSQKKYITCEECEMSILSTNLNRHKRTVHTQGNHQCRISGCSKEFAAEYYRNAHEKTHDIIYKFCIFPYCNKKFRSENGLKFHKRSHFLKEEDAKEIFELNNDVLGNQHGDNDNFEFIYLPEDPNP